MRKALSVVTSLFLFAAAQAYGVESTWEYSVQASATVQVSPAQIVLTWPQDSVMQPNSYTVYRKAISDNSWGVGTTLPGTTTIYTDNNVTPGVGYEYQIVKVTSQYTGYGYVCAGINLPIRDSRGTLLLVIDNTQAGPLTAELARLQQDLVGDGWMVKRLDVSRDDAPGNVRNQIKTAYAADPTSVNAVFLFGHVPVPYSGNIVPDGHVPNHQGAWPCDGFYGDIDGTWTDSSVSTTSADSTRNQNVPGDGKYDQSTFPAPLKLMVGRVDMANMPGRLTWGGPATFRSETELLRNYLEKDHRFRQKQFDLPRRAYVGDFFGTRGGEAFAASAWRNLSGFFGSPNVVNLPNQGTWVPTLGNTSALAVYGCGAGSYTSIGGLGNADSYNDTTTIELVGADIKAAFVLLFGSWLGDWDSEDNIMRSTLALPSYGLASAWSGRPHWFMHHMALGEPIGYSARLTQNNGPGGLYQNQLNSCAGQIHIALMGDPTLRLHTVAPPTAVTATTSGSGTALAWTPSTDEVVGYHVYSASTASGPFTRLTTSPVTGTGYTDSAAQGRTYMVRAVKRETSGAGTYFNSSQGAFSGGTDTSNNGGSTGGSTGTATNNTSGGTLTNGTPTTTGTLTNSTIWVEDTLPTGALTGTDGGDSWSWVAANPTPESGALAHQSSVATGMHQHFFHSATRTLTVNTGDVLFTYVYLDPASVPNQVMLQWFDGTWEHRAYWGANYISYGTDGTDGRRYMGPLPAAGQWARLQVPAASIGLEGRAVNGMAFTLYNGRATWDAAGLFPASVTSTNTTNTSTNTPPTNGGGNTTNTAPVTTVWVEDALPTGAVPAQDGGDTWNWVGSNPTPISGSGAHQSAATPGVHQHYFTWATQALPVNSGDVLFTYVYLDPATPPSEVMLQWNDGTWEHRAYWGANNIHYGVNDTPNRKYIGPLPAAGQWVCLQVPASAVALEGSSLNGMAFSLFDGAATFDYTGKATGLITNPPATTTNRPPVTETNTPPSDLSWVDDVLPTGAVAESYGGDSWSWGNSNPAPVSGSLSHQSTLATGLHQHFFYAATKTLSVRTGDVLYAYVYLDPANPPSEVMLQWKDSSWEHRAYWGSDRVAFGGGATMGHRYMGAVPQTGRWVRLQVPAAQVGLEGTRLNGMAFTMYNGAGSWDNAGVASATNTMSATGMNQPPVVNTNEPPVANTNNSGTITNSGSNTTYDGSMTMNALPGVSVLDGLTPQMPQVGSNMLHVLTSQVLELVLINTKQPDPAQVSQWNLVDSNARFIAPPIGAFTVTANGQPVTVSGVGFKRTPLYAPLAGYDLRIGNYLYLRLANPVSENQVIEVKNPDGTLWSPNMKFIATMEPLRYSPAVHVNEEGYVPEYPKKAMVGYYLGNLGEMDIPATVGFRLVDANSGQQVFQGTLVRRADVGFTYSPLPYQKVYEADFSSFNTPGEYRLVVPGLGGSMAFLINDGVTMSFARAYALGLFHQRCGTNMGLPYTRFDHDVCHGAPAAVPMPQSSYAFTWTTIGGYANTLNDNNPPQIAPALTSPSAQLFPFVHQGMIDVSGGHHDAGDYSKYTINSASLVHYLMFAVDSFPGVAALDNLGIPESGDGISDILQEAKWEADFLAKMQDDDGGFYFLVYPKEREYEGSVTPADGDPQVVWPKTTSVTAASIGALAQCASSPLFKKVYPDVAAKYLSKAQLGWQFLTNAIAKYGKNGAYQKITHYGDDFTDADEMAWAACEIFLATGDPAIHKLLLAWFDPADPATCRWGWWHMSQCWGHAIRSYAFAPRNGRVASSNQLDATFLGKCQAQIAAAADDILKFSDQSAYGTSFPVETKAMKTAGWYFSCDQAFDLVVGYQFNPKPEYLGAMLANMNYEGGCNPVNVTFVTGLGWKRQRDIVSQWALNDKRVLPPSGIPVGNLQASFGYLWNYQGELEGLVFPSHGEANAPYPFYDRWGDSWNVSAEMVVLNQARGLGMLAFLAAQGTCKTQAWKAVNAQIHVSTNVVPVGQNITVSLSAPGIDLNAARITWEARDQEPAYGDTFTFTPRNNGNQWVEAEAQLPDGRRVFAAASINANAPDIVWCDDTVPAGATAGADGGDSWNWVSANPTPYSGIRALQSALASGAHQQFFYGATATLDIGTGDVLYAWVYLNPANPPKEVMLQWNDGSWEHRAYWGFNNLSYGIDGTASRTNMGALPATGQWVQLKVPASKVNLEGKTLKGMGFTLFDGQATWDAAGRLSSEAQSGKAAVTVTATTATASRLTASAGEFTFTRTGPTNAALNLNYTLAGSAISGFDYVAPAPVVIPAGAKAVSLRIVPLASTNFVAAQSVVLTLASNANYSVGPAATAQLLIGGNTVPSVLAFTGQGPTMTWGAVSNRLYRVAYKNTLTEPSWTQAGEITASGTTAVWTDTSASQRPTRFYLVARVN